MRSRQTQLWPAAVAIKNRSAAGVAVGLLLLLFAAQLVHVARLYSLNWDEAHHLYDGYSILQRHDYRANAEVPPLVKIAAALPLLGLHATLPAPTGTAQTENAFLAGRIFVFDNGGDRVLFPARMICMGLTLSTALLIFFVGKNYFGLLAGLVALGLFTFDPNVLAHGTLISTDVGSALFLFAAVWAFYRLTQRPTWIWLVLSGVLTGCAFTAKFTGTLLVPMLLCLSAAEAIRERSWKRLARCLVSSVGTFAIGWTVLWAFYGFRYAPAPQGLELSPALGPYLASMPNPADGAKLALIAKYRLLPEAYIWGLANTKHIEWEYTSYFFGRVYRHGPWQYFPAAFLIKSTLPLLILLALAPVAILWQRRSATRQHLFLTIPIVVYFSVIVSSHFDIGARHLMPVYPFLYVLAGMTAAACLRRGAVFQLLAVVLVGWQVFTTVRVSPNFIAYGNEAWGGPLQVRRYLSDANVDWGQQLKTVKAYLDANHNPDCWFAYFPDGAVEPKDYGIGCHRLPTPSGLWWFGLPTNLPARIHGTVLISESDLDGVESGDGALNPYDSFQKLQPIAVLQDGVYVYQGAFAVPLASAWVDVRHSGDALQKGDLPQALALAKTAVELAPDSALVRVQLADVLAKLKQTSAAREQYKLAEALVKKNRPDLQQGELGPRIASGLASLDR